VRVLGPFYKKGFTQNLKENGGKENGAWEAKRGFGWVSGPGVFYCKLLEISTPQ